MKKNGLTPPFRVTQVATWIIIICIVLVFFTMVLPILQWKVAFLVAFAVSTGLLLYCGYKCGGTDPIDPVVSQELAARAARATLPTKNYSKICTICRTHVSDDSKHCAACNKCVAGFDHHCKWINNCVGNSNYRFFIYLLVSLELFSGVYTSSGVIISYRIMENAETRENVEDLYGDSVWYLICILSTTVVSAFIFLLILHLIVFHIYLNIKGISTYDLILIRRAHRRKKINKVSQDPSKILELSNPPQAPPSPCPSDLTVTFSQLN